MSDTNTALIYTGAILAGFILFIILIAYDDNVPAGLLGKIFCRFNKHRMHKRIGFRKIRLYYCSVCGKSREFPVLKLVDGKAKMKDNDYKF